MVFLAGGRSWREVGSGVVLQFFLAVIVQQSHLLCIVVLIPIGYLMNLVGVDVTEHTVQVQVFFFTGVLAVSLGFVRAIEAVILRERLERLFISAAAVSGRRYTRISRTSPFWSTARHRY